MASGAIIDVAAFSDCVDRLAQLQPVDVPGLTEELSDELHELITKLFGAVGVNGTIAAIHFTLQERVDIQRAFDTIDQAITIVE